MLPLVSIITINYNETALTCDLLNSIQKIDYPNYEILVVDNNSTAKPLIIKKLYPNAKLIMSKKNLGFAGGNNLGIEQAQGDYLFFVNNDTILKPNCLKFLVKYMQDLPNVGAISPKICDYEAPHLLQYAGSQPMNFYTARNSTIGYGEADKQQYNQVRQTPYAHGAAMMVSRKMIEQVGKMPEQFFLYYEELDWCEQIRKAGFAIYFVPNVTVYHKESASVGKQTARKAYYLTRNRILFMMRNATHFQLFVFLFFFFFISIPKNTLYYLTQKQFQHLRAFIAGIQWHFKTEKPLKYDH
ncbi:MAG: glycosyltransferase family 2 protein [Chitinophagales bacterium]